jgi:uncharacterized protein (DUF305 family)
VSRRRLCALTVIVLSWVPAGCGTEPPAPVGPSVSAGVSSDVNATDLSFVRTLLPHLRQGIAIAEPAAGRGARDELRTLAAAIVATQRDEVARLQGWLRAWGRSEPASESASASAPATDARVAALARLSGPKLDAAVLDLLIDHQAAAVRLARAETGGGVNREALAFARQVDASRSAQVRQLTAYRDGGS